MNDKFGLPELKDKELFELGLTSDEVEMFERLAQMEAVHNELGENLSAYRESILKVRNDFVDRISRKYGIEKPRDVAFDPVTKKIISAFHPRLKLRTMVGRPQAFKVVASELVIEAIKRLGEIFKSTEVKWNG